MYTPLLTSQASPTATLPETAPISATKTIRLLEITIR
jgi:hypothetical protein